jgi:hypothetical protein
MRKPRKSKLALWLTVSLLTAGCDTDTIEPGPKTVVADEREYLACKDLRVNTEGRIFGGTSTFKATFTDNNGLKHILHGLKTVYVSDIPQFTAVLL